MSSQVSSGTGSARASDALTADVGEIFHRPNTVQLVPVLRDHLPPEQAAVSLPAADEQSDGPVRALTQFLGLALTSANAVWSGDPVPLMRGLEKKLVEHSLGLPEGERGSCLEAISVVEKAVQWRLRLQQMRMTETELEMPPAIARSEEVL